MEFEKYMRDIRHFKEFAKEAEINKEIVLLYKAMVEENYALTSANSMLAALNSFLRFSEWNDLCVWQPRVQKKSEQTH